MAKQPKLVLRESCVNDVSKDWKPGSFVEMGAGTGGMTRLFLDRGFFGACHDLGADSREMMRINLSLYQDSIRIVDSLKELKINSYDYLFAFEVLEHIQDDRNTLLEWAKYIKPGGKLLISVPAHRKKYGKSDELVGHVRRYEKSQLYELIDFAGFENIRIINYGYPITELTRSFSNFLVQKENGYDGLSAEQRSIRSAQMKPKRINSWLKIFSGRLVTPFCGIQRCFYNIDLGDGYVATAVKAGKI